MELLKPTYEDTDKMTFGKHNGELLEKVPASYLHWWYHNTDRRDVKLKNYIENSWSALQEESKDLIWKKIK